MSVTISGTSGYLADFSNATLTSRQAFQTSTVNGSTGIYALPNGTSTAASWQATNAADPTNASKILIATNGSTDCQLVSGRNGTGSYLPLTFYTNGSEQVRLDIGGNFLVGTTSSNVNATGWQLAPAGGYLTGTITGSNQLFVFNNTSTSGTASLAFRTANVEKGSIAWTNSATAYNTSSDYRLKNTITPMTGALAKVAALKPCTYKWNVDGSDGEGFIAHELAEICPHAVTGEKDAVDADGNPKYQGIDTSFLVATLTAAIQELNAKFEEYKAAHP
jgi:Chaperone of endosialidase